MLELALMNGNAEIQKETKMAKVNMALNGRILENVNEDETLESLADEWKLWAALLHGCEFHYSSAMQIVYRDTRYGTVLTAWVTNPSDCVSFQVLEMG